MPLALSLSEVLGIASPTAALRELPNGQALGAPAGGPDILGADRPERAALLCSRFTATPMHSGRTARLCPKFPPRSSTRQLS